MLGMIIYLAFMLITLDLYYFDTVLKESLLKIQAAAVGSLLLLMLSARLINNFIKAELATMFALTSSGLALCFVIVVTEAVSKQFYWATYVLVILFPILLSEIRLRFLAVTQVLLLALFLVTISWFTLAPTDMQLVSMITMCAVSMVSMSVILFLESQRRINFLQQQSLLNKVEKMGEVSEYLQNVAYYDELTKIPNLRFFDSVGAKAWRSAQQKRVAISVMILDMDYFKKLIDGKGQSIADECLFNVANSLKSLIKRPTDFLARFDERRFVVLLGETEATGGVQVAEKMRALIESQKTLYSGQVEQVTMSVGVATIIPTLQHNIHGLIATAFSALEVAKTAGHNRVSFKKYY